MNRAQLRIQFASAAQAQQAGQALAPDHDGHVVWSVEGSFLILEARSDTTLGLVRTLDDALGCIRALGVA
jgi:hypothetical protein